jgi:PBSX family phage terminase large subunit
LDTAVATITTKGGVDLMPTPKQAYAFEVLNDPETLVLLFGGAIRGGKTYFMFLVLLTYALQYPNSRWAIVRKSYQRLHDTTMPSWFQFISNYELQNAITEYTKTRTRFYNNSEIIFLAESIHTDPELNRFRGLEVNGFGLEELNELSEKTLHKCIERAGTWFHAKDAPRKIIATCNPTDNWVKDVFYTPAKNKTLPEHFKYVPSKITDNPHLPDGYLESLKATMDINNFERFVNGDWEVISDGLIKSDWFKKISFQDLYHKGIADKITWHAYLDGAYTDKTYNDPTALLIAGQYEGCCYVRYVEARHIESADVLKWVSQTFRANGQTPQSLLKIEPKASGKTLVQLARRTTGGDYLPAVEYQYPTKSKLSLNSSKVERVSAITSFLQAGRCYLITGAWNHDFIRECANFPNAEHDDRLDCLVFAILETMFEENKLSVSLRR